MARELDDWLAVMPGSVDVEVEAVRQRVGRVARQFDRMLGTVAQGLDLTTGDLQALAALRRARGSQLTPTALGAALGLTSGTVSTRIERLARAGLVEQVVASDGRSRPVRLSRKGRARWTSATTARTAQESRALRQVLTARQLDQLGRLLGTVLAALESDLGPAAPLDTVPER